MNGKGLPLAILLVALLSTIFGTQLPSVSAHPQERIVGVQVGDWVKYGNVIFTFSSEDPNATAPPEVVELNNTEWMRTTVSDVSGTNVTFQKITRFKNGSEPSETIWIDVATGETSEAHGLLISANLTTGDTIYPSPSPDGWVTADSKINETISRTWLGITRMTNHMNETQSMTSPYGSLNTSVKAYWDKYTGVVLKFHMDWSLFDTTKMWWTNMSISMKILDTHLWGSRVFSITVYALNFNVYATSNASISNFDFNKTLKQVSFNVTGFTGTGGFCNVSIPGDLLWGDFYLYLDDSLLTEDVDYTQTFNGTHYIFHINYSHSTHVIKIVGTEVVPEFPTWMSIILVLVMLTLAIAIYKRKLLKAPIH